MAWNTKIFAYCERGADPAFWAEPFNAITNAAFLIAGLGALVGWSRLARDRNASFELCLIGLIWIIGAGSFLFHTYATRWAALADVLPITLFMVLYLIYALRRFVGTGVLATAGLTLAFAASLPGASWLAGLGGGLFAGSAGYLPALAVLVIVGTVLQARSHPAAKALFASGAIFAMSLTLRTLDPILCEGIEAVVGQPYGTHFLWHILNATLLYILLRAALRHGAPGQTGVAPGTRS